MDLMTSGKIKNLSRRTSPYVYNEDTALMKYRAKKAKVKAGIDGILNINFLGTSITEGYGITIPDTAAKTTKAYFPLVRSAIQTKYGDVGEGFVPEYVYVNNLRYSYGGTWTDDTQYGISRNSKKTIVANSTLTFTFSGTGVDIIAVKYSGGATISCVVDGGAPVVFDTYNATIINAATFSITGLTDGSHTLVITKSNDTKGFYFIGCTPTGGTCGIRCNMMGKPSAVVNKPVGTQALDAEFLNAPDLTIIEFMANDAVFPGTSIASYTSDLQTLITRAKQTGDVILVGQCSRTDVSATISKQYLAVVKSLAMSNNCVFIDMFSRWGSDGNYANSTLGLLYDTVHPNEAGHQDMATAILSVIDR